MSGSHEAVPPGGIPAGKGKDGRAEEAIRIGGEQVSFDAIRRLRVGGVIINGTSTWRTDRSRSAT